MSRRGDKCKPSPLEVSARPVTLSMEQILSSISRLTYEQHLWFFPNARVRHIAPEYWTFIVISSIFSKVQWFRGTSPP